MLQEGDTINERIIICGGGTGGHIPLITIYKEIMKQWNPDAGFYM